MHRSCFPSTHKYSMCDTVNAVDVDDDDGVGVCRSCDR